MNCGRSCFILLFLTVIVLSSNISNLAYGVSTTKKLSESGRIYYPTIAAHNEHVYVAWSNDSSGSGDIFFRQSVDNGSTFGPIVNLSDNNGSSISPAIAVYDNTVYVVWSDDSAGTANILLRKSTDGGGSFATPVALSNRMEHSDMPQIALSDKDTVLVTWSGCTGGLYTDCENIFLVKSVDAGHIFAEPVKISNSTYGGILDNKLLVNSSNLYSAWIGSTPGESYDIYFRKSDDRGDHLGDIIKLSANASTSTCGCSHPRLSLAGSNLYMTWQGSASVKTEDNKHASAEIVYLRESKDNGQTFGDLIQLSNSSSHSFKPNISASYNNVYVTWNELTGNSSIAKLLLRKSSNAGSSFGNEINLTESAGPRTKSVLFVSNNTVFVGWTDISSRIPRVVVRLSSDNGTEFTKAINLSNSSENSYPLQVAASDNGYLYVQWVAGGIAGGTDPKGNKYDLYVLPIEISHQSYSSFPKYSLSLDGHEILVPWKMQYGVISNIEAEDQSRNITITFQKPLQQPDNLTIAVPRDFVYPPGNLNTIQYVQDFVVDANGKLIDYDKLQIDLEYNVIRIPVSSGTASVHISSAKPIPEVPVSSLLDLLGLSTAIALAFISLMNRNNGHRDYKLISEG